MSTKKHFLTDDEVIGKNIRSFRLVRGLTQTELGAQLVEPVSFQQIQKYEGGVNSIRACVLREIAIILRVDLERLFDGCGGKISPKQPTSGELRLLHEFSSVPARRQELCLRLFEDTCKNLRSGGAA